MGGVVAVLVMAVLALAAPAASAEPRPPLPEPNLAVTLLPRPCALEGNDPYERRFYELEGWSAPNYERYPGACQRLRFAYGPILVKPGQNDVLVRPVTIEKLLQNGYITRFRPDLVRQDGTVPPIEQVHLHHGTWLSEPSYGSGPFFALARVGTELMSRLEHIEERADAAVELLERLESRADEILALGASIDARGGSIVELGDRLEELGKQIYEQGELIERRAAEVAERGGELVATLPTLEAAVALVAPLEGAVERLGRMVDRLPGGARRGGAP